MKNFLALFIGMTLLIFVGCSDKRKGEPTVLVFTKTAGFVHQSIPKGVAAIQKLVGHHAVAAATEYQHALRSHD